MVDSDIAYSVATWNFHWKLTRPFCVRLQVFHNSVLALQQNALFMAMQFVLILSSQNTYTERKENMVINMEHAATEHGSFISRADRLHLYIVNIISTRIYVDYRRRPYCCFCSAGTSSQIDTSNGERYEDVVDKNINERV